jgi:predicted PurR-regulated permease PerM
MKNTPQSELPASAETVATPDQPSLRVSMTARGVGIAILATVATVWVLEWAQVFFVSLLMGILISYTLYPLVNGLERIKIPRAVAATMVMVTILFALVLGAYSLRGQLQTIVNQLPTATAKISKALDRFIQSQQRIMQKVQSAAKVFEKKAEQPKAATPPAPPATSKQAAPLKQEDPDVDEEVEDLTGTDPKPAATPPPTPPPPVQVVIEQSTPSKLPDYLWAGSVGAIGILGQVMMVIFLVYFLLLTGDTFKRKLVRIAGPTLSSQKITLTILDDINHSIQRYMFMLLITNVMVGVFTWIAFRLIGLDNAGAWAVGAGVLHLIPYLGPALTAGAAGMAAFLQFNTFSSALLVAGASLVVATLIGTFVTTWMTGRIAKMNTAAVFISLLFWGWLWGIWGLLLGIPIIVIIKVVSQQVEQLHPVAELLGE